MQEMYNISAIFIWGETIKSSPPVQNGRRFADDIFICIFLDEKFCILIKNFTEVWS